ncbi:tyrosine-type recombinase/integrase [Methyloligella solikamskensis]|uniref:Tyrosine-type recombinase/integrase n=1 Tax=Methyloligella solikamskensis TaxID=1177756 RepID=A0ABW3JCJ6_9HYPH
MAKILTDAVVRKATRPGIIWDGAATGLGLKVLPSAKRVWVMQLVWPGQKTQSRRRLGHYPAMSLADAREKAQEFYALAKSGVDPFAKAEEERADADARRRAEELAARTFGDFAEQFITERSGNRRAKTDAREIRRNLISIWGDRPLRSITPRDVRELITALRMRAPYEAKNAWTHTVGIFKAAVHEELIEASPCASLDKRLLFKDAGISPRDRILSEDEVFALWRAAGRIGHPYGDFYRLLLLTGLRVNELGRARWSELHPQLRSVIRDAGKKGAQIDWTRIKDETKLLTIPAARFKSKLEHLVPLSDDACQILADLPRFADCDFLFTTTGTVPINGHSKAKRALDASIVRTLRAMAKQRGDDPRSVTPERWVLHDLRRVVRTNLAALQVDDHVAEMAIGHGRTGLQRVYDQHKYLPEIRQAMIAWAVRLGEITQPAPTPPLEPSKVVAFNGPRRAAI